MLNLPLFQEDVSFDLFLGFCIVVYTYFCRGRVSIDVHLICTQLI